MALGAVLAVARELRLAGRVKAAVVGAVLASSPLHGTLMLGQIYGVLLVGLVAGWIAERRGRPVLSAVLYGVTVALKPSLARSCCCRWHGAAGLDGEGTGSTISDVSYDAVGCSISQAATSVLTDLVVDRDVKHALSTLDTYVEMIQGRGQVEPDEDVLDDAVAFAGVARYPARVKCALLGWMAFKDAVARAVQTNAGGAG
jgi:SUF system NifU family Fe-S assembly protein